MDSAGHPIIIFTDETDQSYLKELLEALHSVFRSRRTVLLGDPAVEKATGSKDGAFTFATSLFIRYNAAAEMFLDRTQCEPCGLCKAPCRGHSFDEYVLHTELTVTPRAADLATTHLLGR